MEADREGVGDVDGGGESPVVLAGLEHVDESVEKQNRNPRWVREETLVLVEAKKRQAEELGVSVPRSRNVTADERWESIAEYCRANNCDRNGYQCRKRWFALSGDYNKVKDWQRSNPESYWGMKTDRRRENRLPGTFDQVVFSSMHSWLKKDSDADFDSPASRQDEGISSEIEQDVVGQELPDMARGDGNSIPPSEQTGDLGDKRYRNPRWSLQESLVLLDAKRKQEDDNGMTPKAKVRTVSADERWETISTDCRIQGCERNAYQCRKRWSALLGDFKRIREWQKMSTESYWLMKNEKRKESKLPAIFDHEVFANMDTWVGKRSVKKSAILTDGLEEDCARPANGGLFSDVEHDQDGHLEPDLPMGGCQRNTILVPESGTNIREEMPSDSTTRKKRKRTVNGDASSDCKGQQQLTAVLKSSVKAMQVAMAENTQIQIRAHHTNVQAQIEAHNLNSQLDRTQRMEQGENLVGVLGKLAEALGRIAEKLV